MFLVVSLMFDGERFVFVVHFFHSYGGGFERIEFPPYVLICDRLFE